MGKPRRYGRGTFTAHPNYVAYMESIVADPAYRGMPDAVSENGKINWQVSSGKGTSFHKSYEARARWWTSQADALGLAGTGNGQERFTVAARRIHPTGYRACLVCGESRNVGYFYLNSRLATKLNRIVGESMFERGEPISTVIEQLEELDRAHGTEYVRVLETQFPERTKFFEEIGINAQAFERSNHLRSVWLSPGFMANPPDRLDGFHDYCLQCRARSDPGRSAENLRSYQHDRRAFEWWAEGDWGLADALYNAAGPGQCAICGESVPRVSPDHIGPLACGFKHIALFAPTCISCNSSKNRRMTLTDVERLLSYELRTGAGVASRQTCGVWEARKGAVSSDQEANELSAVMRSLQDAYLRLLHRLKQAGEIQLLVSLLNPDFAYFDHTFIDLDPGILTFAEVKSVPNKSLLRQSLACRSIRIAFEGLDLYVAKGVGERKLRLGFHPPIDNLAAELITLAASLPPTTLGSEWSRLVAHVPSVTDFEAEAAVLLDRTDHDGQIRNAKLSTVLEEELFSIGSEVSLQTQNAERS